MKLIEEILSRAEVVWRRHSESAEIEEPTPDDLYASAQSSTLKNDPDAGR